MPQKDLLGHPQTKVFIAHGGTNGVQEAIYHGVPVLGIPLFFDQYDNLLRLEVRGAGKMILLPEVNGENFEKSLVEVLNIASYRENMQRLSRLHRDQPMTPMDQAVFWVEYVMRHKGAPHLRTQAYKMPWYSYYCIDVFMVLLTILSLLLLSTYSICVCLCCRSKRKSKQQKALTKKTKWHNEYNMSYLRCPRLYWHVSSPLDDSVQISVSTRAVKRLISLIVINCIIFLVN